MGRIRTFLALAPHEAKGPSACWPWQGWPGLLLVSLCFAAIACGSDDQGSADYEWDLPVHFPKPNVPEDNPMSAAKVELGRYLFYDTRLSGNQTQGCASCHRQELAFTDGLAISIGSTGEMTPRGSMTLANIAYASTLTWANPLLKHLEQQALVPMFGEVPVELGLAGKETELLDRLRNDTRYQELFPAAFPDQDDPFNIDSVVKAIAAFQRTIISSDSPFDRYQNGDASALDESAKRGMELFFNERLECFHCHGGFNLSASVDHEGLVFEETAFFNNGLYNLDGRGAYPEPNTGVESVTNERRDMGLFKAPTLRNIALTSPYMHDGSIATLDEVLDHYAAGGRLIESGPLAGDGRTHPNKSIFVSGFELNAEERADVLAFLNALTDETFLRDPRYANPF